MKSRLLEQEEAVYKVLNQLRYLVKLAEGNSVSTTASKIARSTHLSSWLVKNILSKLHRAGLVEIVRENSRGRTYALSRDSPLWRFLESAGDQELHFLARAVVTLSPEKLAKLITDVLCDVDSSDRQ